MTTASDLPPLDRILPHRSPFLLVDRVIELDPSVRIVAIKHVSYGERHLAPGRGGAPVMPLTMVMESVAQVGAVLVLSMPENRDKLAFLLGIERVRQRKVVRAGDTMVIEVTVQKLRATTGRMAGRVRVDGRTIATGVMTFALSPRSRVL
jgi:3-hydroxyacyl-[acyl-carrier-protein] dehydratase